MPKNEDAGTTAREAIYDAKIAPLMTQIIAICKANKIPMVASFDLDGPEDEGLRCSTVLYGPGWEQPETFRKMAALLKPEPALWAFTITSSR